MVAPRRTPLLLPLLAWLVSAIILPANAEEECERLKHTVEYTQEEAPRGFSKIMKAVTDELNKVLDGVIGAEVKWDGFDLHGQVGERLIECKVQRLASLIPPNILQDRQVFVNEAGREVVSQCFQLPFTIYDTNECTLPQGHDMRHQCHEPSICVNTIGSYECLCPRLDGNLPSNVHVQEDSRSHMYSIDVAGEQEAAFFAELQQEVRSPWELALSNPSATTCPSKPSTRGCCPEMAHSRDGQDCRDQFKCPIDPCAESSNVVAAGNHSCAHNAQCVRRESPTDNPNHSCICPDGLLGNGRTCRLQDAVPEPKVNFEGLPTLETTRSDFCGCTKPTVDACAGFPACTNKHEVCVVGPNGRPACGCKKGFVKHEEYGCVDERPPQLKLNEDPHNDQTLRLKQGDFYQEYGVRILDGNAEEYFRMLKITYSEPTHGCLTKVGGFHVNYTLNTPWTIPSSVSITRHVIIEDIDECSLDMSKYQSTCPELIPQCDIDAGAKCVNTIGSYSCECPKFTSGDGFRKDVVFSGGFTPEAYEGGTSCVDTHKPIIELKGPTPKVFKICPCGGLSGVMQDKVSGSELHEAQRENYEHDIKAMIKATHGAELCATPSNSRPRPTSCVNAYDETYKGNVDLSSRVTVGEPVRKSSLHWVVPYNVKDDAGNEATTVWRDVLVDEVDFDAMEAKIRDEAKAAKEIEIKNAVAKAVQEERKKLGATSRRGGTTAPDCPACPKCNENKASRVFYDENKDKIGMAECEKLCEQRSYQCHLRDESVAVAAMVWLEQFFPSWLVLGIAALAFLIGSITVLRLCLELLFNPFDFARNYDYPTGQDRELALQNSVTYYPGGSPQPQQFQSPPNGAPPRASMSAQNSGGDFFMSPSGGSGGFGSPQQSMGTPMHSNGGINSNPNQIYDTPSIIRPLQSPSPNDSGLRRRSPSGYQY